MDAEWSSLRFKWGLPYLLEGETRYVDVVAVDSRGREVDDLPIEYSVSDPAHAEVTPQGALTGVRAGEIEVIARFDGLETRLGVTVESGAPAWLQLSTDFLELNWLEEADIFVTPYNPADRMLDVDVTWTSEDPSVATVEDGHITAVARGYTRIVATAGSASAAVGVRVVSPPVASIDVVEAPWYLEVGGHDTITAVARASNDGVIDDAAIVFESLAPGVVWVESDTGRIKAVGEGAAKIAISAGDARAQWQIFVDSPPAD